MLRFGTGAGITWGSDPDGEWAETQLKAARLVGLTATRRDGHDRACAHASAWLAAWLAAAAAAGGRGTPSSPMSSGVHDAPVTTVGPVPFWAARAGRRQQRGRRAGRAAPTLPAPVDAGILLLGAADRREPPRRAPERGFTATRWGEYPSGGRASGKVGA